MPNNSSQTNKSLDEILAELEQRFGSDSSSSSSSSSGHSPRKKNNGMSPNTIVGALVFTLLVVGVASAMWLGQRGQDVRQQASIYDNVCNFASDGSSCSSGSSLGSSCTLGGQPGTCKQTAHNPDNGDLYCGCDVTSLPASCNTATSGAGCNTGQGIGSACTNPAGSGVCSEVGEDRFCLCLVPTPTPTPHICQPIAEDDSSIDFCDRSGPNVGAQNCTDKDVNARCTYSDVCGGGGLGYCRPNEGTSTSIVECGCFETPANTGGPNPSPSISPSPTPTFLPGTPTPTPGSGGGNTPTPTPTPIAQCPAENRITFSTLPATGTRPADNLIISDQFASQGVNFSIRPQDGDTGTNCVAGNGPRIARVGSPQTAFGGPLISGNTADQPAAGQGVGQDFLTDDGVTGQGVGATCILVMDILPGFRTNRVEFDILDIDGNDAYQVVAFDAAGATIHIQDIPNASLDGQARGVTVSSSSPIAQIQVLPNGGLTGNWGLAYDNVCLSPPAPTPTPVAGQCVSITMTNLDGGTEPPTQGDSVTFTCGQVAGAARYEFRILEPGETNFTSLAPSSTGARVSVPYTFTENGSFRAQCRPCTGTDASTCQAWEQ